MEETVIKELILSNGQKIDVETSIRRQVEGEKSTFISINTGCFRIKIVQRLSAEDVAHNALIAFSTTSETDNLDEIETLVLSLKEAVKFAKRLNEKVVTEDHSPVPAI